MQINVQTLMSINVILGLVLALNLTSVFAWEPLPTMDEWKTWSLEELEKQMNPSNWNPQNLTSEQVIQKYVESGLSGTNQAREILVHSLNVPYGAGAAEKVDFYGTDLPVDSPLFFYIHGGYWQEGSKDISGHFANVLHSWGFMTAVMGYTLAPEARIEDIMTEVVQALQLVSETYPLAKIIVGGHSAGAQLAASLLTRDVLSKSPSLGKRIVGMYFISGVYDLRPLVNTTINKPLKLTAENAEHLSALFNEIHPSWLTVSLKNQVIVGYYDSPEFQRQSTGYYEQLKSQFDTTFWVSQFDDHFSLVEELANPKSETCKKLKTYLQQFKNIQGSPGGSGLNLVNTSLGIFSLLFLILTLF